MAEPALGEGILGGGGGTSVKAEGFDDWLREREERRGQDQFPCPVDGCARVLSTTRLLRGHMETVHGMGVEGGELPVANNETKETFPCDECGRVFGRSQALGVHRRKAHGVAGTTRKPRVAGMVRKPPRIARGDNDQVQDPELENMGKIIRLVEQLSPPGKAWLAARLSARGAREMTDLNG